MMAGQSWLHRSAFAATGRQTAPAARGRASRRNQRRCRRASDILAGRGGSLRRTLRVGDRGSDKPACVPSKSVSPLKRREKDGLVTSGRARRHDVTKGRGGFWGVEGGSVAHRRTPLPTPHATHSAQTRGPQAQASAQRGEGPRTLKSNLKTKNSIVHC